MTALALEIVRRAGNLLTLYHVDDLLSILNYLKRRQDVVSDTGARIEQLRPKTAASDRLDQYMKSKSDNEKKQERLRDPDSIFESMIAPDFWKEFRIESPSNGSQPSITNLSKYLDMLYEDHDRKMQAAMAVYQLSLKKENLPMIAESETLQLVLVRVMREEGRKWIELATLVTAVFANMSQNMAFHAGIAKYKFGSQCLDLMQHEIRKEEAAFQELSQQQLQSRDIPSGELLQNPAFSQPSQEYEQSLKKYQSMVRKQNHFLKAAFCLLLSLSSDQKVERKMLNRGILTLLVKSLEREATAEFFTVLQMFLAKLSTHLENKNQLIELNIIEKLYVILSSTISSSTVSLNINLIHWTLSLLLNLSFDLKLRTNMIQIGVLPKLLYLWSRDRLANQAKTEKLMFQILYQMSRGGKVRGMFNFSFGLGQESLDMMMGKVVKAIDQHAAGHRHANMKEMMALMINLSLCPKNSSKMCDNVANISKLLDIVYNRSSARDADILSVLMLKLLRNISYCILSQEGKEEAVTCFQKYVPRICELTFETTILKKTLDEKIDDGRLCVEQDDLIDTFVTESLGLLSNMMNVPTIDWINLFQSYHIWEWAEKRMNVESNYCEDDLVLDVVLLLGTAATQESCAHYLLSDPNFLSSLIQLMQAKQDDDEIVLQIVFIISVILSHDSTRKVLITDSRITDYLIDMMQDKNAEIRGLCSLALHAIGDESEELGRKIRMQKFKCHNSKWISMMMSQKDGLNNQLEEWSGDELAGEENEDEGDEDDDFHLFLKPDILNSSLDSLTDSNPSTPVAWDMNEMFASDGSRSRASARPLTGYKRRSVKNS